MWGLRNLLILAYSIIGYIFNVVYPKRYIYSLFIIVNSLWIFLFYLFSWLNNVSILCLLKLQRILKRQLSPSSQSSYVISFCTIFWILSIRVNFDLLLFFSPLGCHFIIFIGNCPSSMEEGRSGSKILTGKPTGKRLLRTPNRWEDNIRMDLKEIVINTSNWLYSDRNNNYGEARVKRELKLWVP